MPARIVARRDGDVRPSGAGVASGSRTTAMRNPTLRSAPTGSKVVQQTTPAPNGSRTRATSTMSSTSAVRPSSKVDARKAQTTDNSDDATSVLLTTLASPAKCTPDTAQKLLFMLDTTTNDLHVSLLHVQQSDRTRSVKTSSNRKPTAPIETISRIDDRRATLLAKQVVNASIASLNDLVTTGWTAHKPVEVASPPSSASTTPSSSRPGSSVETKSSRYAASARTQKQGVAQTSSVSQSKVLVLFDCFRIAIRYLSSKRALSDDLNVSQINNIAISTVRKAIALEMFDAAEAELSWLRSAGYPGEYDDRFGYQLSGSLKKTNAELVASILDVQALSFVTALATSSTEDAQGILNRSVEHPNGPIASQSLARSFEIVEAKSIDRCAYTIERAVMRSAANLSAIAFLCRSISLRYLLTVSDLDMEAFWDRVVRVGVSHFRSPLFSEGSKAQAFTEIDDMFKDLCRRVEQQALTPWDSSSAGFQKLCDVWNNMARKVGDVGALGYVDDLNAKAHSTISRLGSAEADALAVRLCSSLAIVETTLSQNTTTEELQSCLSKAHEDVQSILRLYTPASTDIRVRIRKELRILCRRCIALLDEKTKDVNLQTQDKRSSLRIELTRLCTTSGDALRATLQDAEDRDTLVDDYICLMRLLAKDGFEVDDQVSQARSFDALNNCDSLIRAQDGDKSKTAERRRILSMSWHYAGALLYANKQPALAIPFLERAAEGAAESHRMWKSIKNADDEQRYAQEHQLSVLPKRWEHLGMAFRLTSQAERAESAYRTALEWIAPATWSEIARLATYTSVSHIFISRTSDDPQYPISEVATLVRTLFELQTFDLLRFEKKEKTLFADLAQCEEASDALPTLVEYCLSICQTSREEALKAHEALVELACERYSPSRNPFRLARVLIRTAEVAQREVSLEVQKQRLESIGQLLYNETQCEDIELAKFKDQYNGMLFLLRAQLAFSSNSPTEEILQCLDSACDKFRRYLPRVPNTVKTPSRRPLRNASAPRQDSKRSEIPLKTPSRVRKAEQIADTDVRPVTSDSIFDDVEHLLRLLDLAQEMDVIHGSPQHSLQLLRISQRIAREQEQRDTYLRMTVSLVQHHLAFGQIAESRALVQSLLLALDEQTTSADVVARCRFAEAEVQCHDGEIDKAMQTFNEAVAIAEQSDVKARGSGLTAGTQRVLLSERFAIAFELHSKIQLARHQFSSALQSSIFAVKAAMRGGLMLSRLSQRSSQDDHESPFVAIEEHSSDDISARRSSETESRRAVVVASSTTLAVLHWRMIKRLYAAYLRVGHLYTMRGSARDAEAFLGECVDFAKRAYSTASHSFALLERGRLRLQMGQLEKSTEDVEAAMEFASVGEHSLASASLAFLQGDRHLRCQTYEDAAQRFVDGKRILAQLANNLRHIDTNEPILNAASPLLMLLILRREAHLMHLMGNEAACTALLEELRGFETGPGENSLLRGKVAVRRGVNDFKKDQILNLVLEAVVSTPVAISIDPLSKSRGETKEATKDAQSSLDDAVRLLDEIIVHSAGMASTSLQEAVLERAYCQTLLSSLPSTVVSPSRHHDPASAITLEREMDEAIEAKVAVITQSGKVWPRFDREKELQKTSSKSKRTQTLLSTTHKSTGRGSAMLSSGGEESSSEGEHEVEARAMWSAAKERRAKGNTSTPDLPSDWTVVSIALSSDRTSLLVSRRTGNDEEKNDPIVFSLPIDRQSRREGEEGVLGVDSVLSELREIITESNTATHSAQNLEGLEARKAWWTRRRELDARLKALLGAVEASWLGAFKCVVLPEHTASMTHCDILSKSIEEILTKACGPSTMAAGGKRGQDVTFNRRIFDLFSLLDPATCSDEDLEDVVHFAMDAFQFCGVPVAVDEVDLDVCVTDLRSALEASRNRQAEQVKGQHLFLLLDKEISEIPWESMPCLRGKAICRIPSLAALYDRLALAPQGRFTVPLRSSKFYYLVNPSKELVRTQNRFLPFFTASSSDAAQPRWRGIAGRAPAMDEFGAALETNDVVAYFGHGGAEQFVRTSRLRSMMRCAVTMLWGCSSGVLRSMGDFERSGTPNNYILAGCPSLVGNLWDATDKELDGVSEHAMRLMGLIPSSSEDRSSSDPPPRLSIAQAVAQSRDACKLPYLTGAACIVYGVPVYFD